MPILTYLNFSGNCREAFDFYKTVFGGEYETVMTFAGAPPEMGVPESDRDKIMHASLKIGDSKLMASDVPSNFPQPRVAGNNFALSYMTKSREETDELFGKISEGGTVNMPLEDTFWGAYFGMCTDKFGIHWQFNCDLQQQ